MLIDGCDLCELIHKGGILTDVEGSTVEELFADISKKITLPSSLDKNQFVKELLEREAVLSTAVGNGISIPHPRRPVMKEKEQERLIVCYLKNPIDMNAPDGQKVHSMFILLSKVHSFTLRLSFSWQNFSVLLNSSSLYGLNLQKKICCASLIF